MTYNKRLFDTARYIAYDLICDPMTTCYGLFVDLVLRDLRKWDKENGAVYTDDAIHKMSCRVCRWTWDRMGPHT
jgi:hypothetical protein